MRVYGENLKATRLRAGLNQKQLANQIGVAQATVANYELGKRFPNGDILLNIAKVLDTSIDQMMGYNPLGSEESMITIQEKAHNDLKQALINHDLVMADQVFLSLRPGKDTALQIFDDVLLPTFRSISQMWVYYKISTEDKEWMHKRLRSYMIQLSDIATKEGGHNHLTTAIKMAGSMAV